MTDTKQTLINQSVDEFTAIQPLTPRGRAYLYTVMEILWEKAQAIQMNQDSQEYIAKTKIDMVDFANNLLSGTNR